MALDSDEIKELVERAKRLDAEAFGRLYDMYYEQIYRYAYFKTGSLIDSEDLAAQVFLGALKNIKNFSWRQASFAAWLFRIAHNVVVDYWRKRGRATFEPIDEHVALTDGGNVAVTVIANLRFEKLQQALTRLTEDQSRIITLRFMNALSTKETAAVMRKSVGAVKAQQFRALENLRRLLDGEQDG